MSKKKFLLCIFLKIINMSKMFKNKSAHKQSMPEQKFFLIYIVLVLLFIISGAVRLYESNSPKPYFYSRQFRSFIIARAFYLERSNSIPAWRNNIAQINKEAFLQKEPPFVEYIVSLVYQIAGGESHWISSMVCSVFWLIGAIFIFLIVRKYVPPAAVVISSAFYLFNLFGIFMSRSFQPESFMIMMLLIAVYTILNYYEKTTTKRLLVMSIIMGLAVFSKFVIIFPLWAAFIAGGISKKGFRSTLLSLQHLIFVLIGVLPGFVYYFYLAFFSDQLQRAAESIFLPQMLMTSFFWVNWLVQLGYLIGYIPLVLGIMGLFLVRNNLIKSILAGMVIGHIVYCLLFAYTTATHTYYQVQLIPIVALALAPTIALLIRQFQKRSIGFRLSAITGLVFFVMIFMFLLITVHKGAFRNKNKNIQSSLSFGYKCFGIKPEDLAKYRNDYDAFVRKAKLIAEVVNHSDKTITLAPMVTPFWYYGEYAGSIWPSRRWDTKSLQFTIGKWKRYQGKSAEELFATYFLPDRPEYFIIANMTEFQLQEDLRELLYRKFNVLVKNDDFLVFDLKTQKEDYLEM